MEPNHLFIATIKRLAAAVLLTAALTAPLLPTRAAATGPTYVSGIITADTTWTEAGSPYIVTGETIVERDVTLTIQPGVVVRFDGPFQLEVVGGIRAIGAPAKPIVFTRHREGQQWKGVYSHGVRGGPSQYAAAEFRYVTVEYAEVGIRLVMQTLDKAHTYIRDSLFQFNGLGYSAGSATIEDPTLRNNVVRYNKQGAIAGASVSGHVIEHNEGTGLIASTVAYSIIADNGGDGIVGGSDITRSIIRDNRGNGIVLPPGYSGYPIRNNSITGNAGYALKNEGDGDFDVRENWWGTTNPEAIKTMIYDFSDDRLLGKVNFTPFLTAPPEPCSWAGTWSINSGEERFFMFLSHSATTVTGTYAGARRIEASISGISSISDVLLFRLEGRWAEPPTYAEPDDAGRFVFGIAPDCGRISGTWGFGDSASDGGTWSGVRLATPGPCSWSGFWDTLTGSGEQFPMALVQNGASVTGTYGSDRRLEGTAYGAELSGRWAGPPSYTEPDNAGPFLFNISSDCGSFTGAWGFGSGRAGGAWAGTRVSSSPERAQVVAELYRSVLCREPDPTGLQYWVDSGLPVEQIKPHIESSSEARRLEGIRALYVSILGRDPLGPTKDCAGIRSWAYTSLTFEEIRSGLLTSQERLSKVRELYLQVLARDPLWADPIGLRYWAERAVSLDELRGILQTSAEGQRVLAIRQLYIELLGRDPLGTDTTGLRYWVDSGMSLEEIRQVIMQSGEYRRRVGA